MILNHQVLPSKEEFIDFMKTYPKDQPVTMINILKFKVQTGNGTESGREAYQRYSRNVSNLLKKAGGKIRWAGRVNRTIIGDYNDQPDLVLLVEYPSVQAFIEMSTAPEYEKIGQDRKIALEYGGLWASSAISEI